MSGIAIFTQSTFSEHLKVTPIPSESILVAGITISGDAAPYGMSSIYTVAYAPSATTQKGVIWSIQNGGNYGTINNGVLRINENANSSQIIIRATSMYDVSIYCEIAVVATYNSGGLSRVIQEYCDRVVADGGTLSKGTALATQEEYNAHISILGTTPKLDFLGYKQSDGIVSKLYSIDETFDCVDLTGVIIQNGVITTELAGIINYPINFTKTGNLTLTKMYYEGNVVVYGGKEAVFIDNLLKTGYNDSVSAIFYTSGYISVQYRTSTTCCSSFPISGLTKMLIEVDGSANTEGYDYVKKLLVDDADILSTKQGGIDFWNVGINDKSFIKLYNGFNLCIAG